MAWTEMEKIKFFPGKFENPEILSKASNSYQKRQQNIQEPKEYLETKFH